MFVDMPVSNSRQLYKRGLQSCYLVFLWTLSLLLVSAGWVSAQPYSSQNGKAVKLFEKGQDALYQSRGDEAVRCFRQALEVDPEFVECHIMLAEWCLDHHDSAQASTHYYNAVRVNPQFFTLAWYELGGLELDAGNYDKAVENYQEFLRLDTKNKDRHAAAQYGIDCARFRKEAMAFPVPFTPQNLGPTVNTGNNEYLPALTVDGHTLIFTRRFPRNQATTANTMQEEDLFVSERQGEGSNAPWSTARRMDSPVNSHDNEGAQCISQDGRILFFTACDRPDGVGRCDLYMCVRRGDSWSKPRNLGPQVNSEAWESQPSFSIDGQTLYFVSDRKGGYGGMDIWKTTFDGRGWTAPENLGPVINTPADDMTPFIHYDDRTLYFTSGAQPVGRNGDYSQCHVGMGGFDIFVSQRQEDGTWSTPHNLGYPINTPDDESSLIVSADGRTAFFSSSRDGGYGEQDIYSFELPVEARPDVTICMKGVVTNAKNGGPVGADVKIIDLASGAVVANTSSDAQKGSYIVSLPAGRTYVVHVSADGYLFYSGEYELGKGVDSDWNWTPEQVNIALHPIEAGERVALRNIFFESGRYNLLDASHVELDKVVEFLSKNATLRVEIGGHTDNVGRPDDNQRLSEQRARAVYDYLVSRGIAGMRLSYKGYGETQPVSSNDTDEGRAANRRTEIKIL